MQQHGLRVVSEEGEFLVKPNATDLPGDLKGLRLERVDPKGEIGANIEPQRVVGSLARISPPTSSNPASSAIQKATGSVSGTGRHAIGPGARHRRGLDRRGIPVSNHHARPPRNLGEAHREHFVQPD
jgi:hypothetical protein